MSSVKVSFLIPLRNDNKRIEKTLKSLLEQDYPKSQYEVLIAIGKSTDSTRKILDAFKKQNKKLKIRVFKNPSGNTATGRNICLKNAKGTFVVNYSGHAIAEKNFIKTLAGKLEKSKADVASVGCPNISPEDDSFVGKIIAIVYSSLFGGVKSFDQNYNMKKDSFVKSIAFTMYKKEKVLEVGGFDDAFWVGQDFELNYRLKKKSYRHLLTPETVVYRYNRASVGSFAKQIFKYGIARALITRKHPESLKIQYIIPSILAGYMIFMPIIGVFNKEMMSLFLVSLAAYAIIGIMSSALVSKSIIGILISPVFYFIQHVFYGLGFIAGIFIKKMRF